MIFWDLYPGPDPTFQLVSDPDSDLVSNPTSIFSNILKFYFCIPVL